MLNNLKENTNMDKKIKTELTRDEVVQMLDLYNTLDNALDNIVECLDVDISTLRDLRQKAYDLQELFNFRAVVDEDGHPKHWKSKVLPDADNAWYYEPKE
jgi:hypothetical protein